MITATRLGAIIAGAFLVAGCAEPTQLVVFVWTDMTVPTEVEQVRVRVFAGAETAPTYDSVIPLPPSGRMDFRTELSFGAGPRGEDASRRVRVLVDAIRGGESLFTTEVRTGFARRKKLRLDVYLARRCLTQAETCLPDETCGLDGCVSPDVPVETLPPADTTPVIPSDPRMRDAGGLGDAGVSSDAGPGIDGGSIDAGALVDAAVLTDVGSPPDAAPSGVALRQLAPLSSARFVTSNVTLRWEMPAPAAMVEYQVYLRGGAVPIAGSAVRAASVTLAPYPAGHYAWRIRSITGATPSAWSPIWYFTVAPTSAAAGDKAWGTYPDVNGDGLGDVVVAAPFEPGRVGAAEVSYFLSAVAGLRTAPSTTALTDPTSQRLAIACAGDVNGDGFVDVLVGSPDSELTRGIVDVLYGSSSGLASAAGTTLRPLGPGELFGASVASAGDVDSDGYADIIVGAPDAGVAYVYRGGATGVDPTPFARLVPPAGVGTALNFGAAVAGTDLDADGRGDIIVGHPSAYTTYGALYSFRSAGTGFDAPAPYIDPMSSSPTAGFGSALASGEATATPYGEVAILRALGYAGAASSAHGSASGVLIPGLEITTSSRPVSITAAGDITGDYHQDVIIGDPYGAGSRGVALLVHPVMPEEQLGLGVLGDHAGGSVAYLGDVDGDGADDLAYTASGGARARVKVYYGPRPTVRLVPVLYVSVSPYAYPVMRIAGAQ